MNRDYENISNLYYAQITWCNPCLFAHFTAVILHTVLQPGLWL